METLGRVICSVYVQRALAVSSASSPAISDTKSEVWVDCAYRELPRRLAIHASPSDRTFDAREVPDASLSGTHLRSKTTCTQ